MNSKFYDSENIEGQLSWKKLQSYMNKASDKNLKRHRSASGIKNTWFQERDLITCQEIIHKIKILSQEEKI